MHKLSVVIISRNEEEKIEYAVKSALFSDEVLVLNSGSEDRTCEIAETLGARVLHQEWLGFGRQKNRAVELAENDWVFVLDSDERINEALKKELLTVLKAPEKEGYYVPRLNNFWGKDVRTCGLYLDYSIRLFDRRKGKFSDDAVHESVQLQSKAGYLKNPLEHLVYKSIDEFIMKKNRYSTLHHKKKSKVKAILNPSWTFFKLFILKKGFMDGWDGFVIGNESEGRELSRLAEDLGVDEFLFCGYHRDVIPFISLFDVGFILSDAIETVSYAAREMMSMGKPLISSTYSGLKENVDNEVNGFLVKPGDVEAAANAMEKFLTMDKQTLSRMSNSARNYAVDHFDVHVQFNVHDHLYSALAQRYREERGNRFK